MPASGPHITIAISGSNRRNGRVWRADIRLVDYRDVQFTKDPNVARAMGLEAQKSNRAVEELRAKGLA